VSTVGAIASIIDGNITTYYQSGGSGSADEIIHFDFNERIHVKNIMAYFGSWQASAGSNITYLEGSRDNSSWTEIAKTASNSSTSEVIYNLSGANQKYRYFRLRMDPGANAGYLKTYDILITV